MASTAPDDEWASLIMGRVNSTPPNTTMSFNASAGQADMIRRAAKLRGISAGAYMRNAALAFACKELGLEFDITADRDQDRGDWRVIARRG